MLCFKDIKYACYVQQFNNYKLLFILLVLTIFLNMIILVSSYVPIFTLMFSINYYFFV